MTTQPLNVVAVHGIRCGGHANDVAGYENQWAEALEMNLQRPVSVRMAYWYPALGLPTAMGADALPMLTEEDEQLAKLMLADLGGPARTPQGGLGRYATALLDTLVTKTGLDRRYDQPFVRHLLREIVRYFHADHADKRAAARAVVADAIADAQPDVVIAHSFGSVIAYETLWHNHLARHKPLSGTATTETLRVPLLLTIGSPLCLPGAIKANLDPQRFQRPPNVDRWVNVRETGDPICAVGRMRHEYEGVTEDQDLDIPGTFIVHASHRYLSAPTVGALIERHTPALHE